MKAPIEKEKQKAATTKVVLICGIVGYLYLLLTYLHAVAIQKNNPRINFFDALNMGMGRVITKPLEIFPISGSTLMNSLLFTIAVLTGVVMVVTNQQMKKHDNPDTVNGEAHLMNREELAAYNLRFSSPLGKPENNGANNMIISKDIRLAIDNRGTRRNCNILVIGGSGAGKSRFFAAPNILQYNCNFVITDPSGEMLRDYGKALEDVGYNVKVFNLTDVYRSNRYNPFHYIRDEKDVFTLVNTLIKNTTPSEGKAGDPFWENSEKLLLTALILYLWHTRKEEEQTFTNVVKLVTMAEVDENDATAKSPLDILFDDLEKEDPENLAVKQYKKFKIGAGKTLKSILISVGVRLQSFDLSDIQYLTEKDDFEFERFSDTKQALFVIIPTADTTFNFLVSLLYSQLFTSLYTYAETQAEFAWKVNIDPLTNLNIFHANGKADSENAKAAAERYVANIKKGTKMVHDTIKDLYCIYTIRDASAEEKAFIGKQYYVLFEKDSGDGKVRLYRDNFAGFLFEDQEEGNRYILRNELKDKAYISVKPVTLNEKFLLNCYKSNAMTLIIKRLGVINTDRVLAGEKIGWRGTKKDAEDFVSQLKNLGIEKCRAACPNHVRLILDEFANIGQIPDFNEKLATMRKYEISCSIILQALSQLKDIYKDKWNTIVANCDTKLFLGCDDSETIEWMLKMLGKKTTTVENTSWQAGGAGSTSYNKSSIEVMTIDQISMMQDDECLVRIRGVRPHYGKKYELTDHPNYKYAKSQEGKFIIPLANDVKQRDRGPLWQRMEKKLEEARRERAQEAAPSPAETPEVSVQAHTAKNDAEAVRAKNEARKEAEAVKAKNAARKEDAKGNAAAVADIRSETTFEPKTEEMIVEGIAKALGITGPMDDKAIKEHVDTMITLMSLPSGDLTYAATE